MEYPNSRLVDRSSYDTNLDGLCTDIPVRVHHSPELADRGAFRAQKDWERAFGSLPPRYAGNPGPDYNFVSTCFPEILPNRLELVAYVMETAFLVDDMMDAADSPMAAAAPFMADVLQAYNATMAGGEAADMSYSPAASIMTGFAREMVAIDAEQAKETFRWLGKWVKSMLSHSCGEKKFQNLDEYLEYRRVNYTTEAAFGLLMFGMGLSIPENQQQTWLELSQPLWLHGSLANDYQSWEREHKIAIQNGQGSVMNAIWVLMNKHSMACDEAKAVCREKARHYAAEYVQLVEATKARDDLCRDAKHLFDVLRFWISGSAVWGLQCPRYHADRTLNPAQLEVRRAIWADETIAGNHDQPKAVNVVAERPGVETNGVVPNGTAHGNRAAAREVPPLSAEALEAPSRYLDSLPAKGIRDIAIDALNLWFKVSPAEVTVVKEVVNLLHGASLMLDDIHDASQLRRGKPATHIVFGTVQTTNSTGYRYLLALAKVRKLESERGTEELSDLYIGQSHDLYWTCNLVCPTEDEYLAMVDGKTAGLFRLLARMLDAKSDAVAKPDLALLTRFMTLTGRLFQIRDDYMNLTSADYTKQKGYCEDLDEGKYSLPLIHALGQCDNVNAPKMGANETSVLRNLLSQRHVAGRMSLAQKKLFLEHLTARGSLEYTRQALNELQAELRDLSSQMNMRDNEDMKGLLAFLRV
ncbi:terpenoid synthase [Parathielavia hyrcaniae]|uniref:Terpenoid synthase n=1 Tax=Parathielavia hyrcaniae TaxID=113614 RepID=A0AAN6Q2L7_9PEZI|nr:terpenoid synthase [Parathielavia hyrcaniae]